MGGMKLRVLTVTAVLIATLMGCYAEWDSVRTKPWYASQYQYVHYPAPYRPAPTSSRSGP